MTIYKKKQEMVVQKKKDITGAHIIRTDGSLKIIYWTYGDFRPKEIILTRQDGQAAKFLQKKGIIDDVAITKDEVKMYQHINYLETVEVKWDDLELTTDHATEWAAQKELGNGDEKMGKKFNFFYALTMG